MFGFCMLSSGKMSLLLAAILLLWDFGNIRADNCNCCLDGSCYCLEPPCYALVLPQCPEILDIDMQVYTKENPTDGQLITRDIVPEVFNGERMTVFIVHGWIEDENSTYLHDMKDAFLARDNYNVIIVGWSTTSQLYIQSAANTRTVGSEIALVINNTIDNAGSSKERQSCVGHGLGAHVCGEAGRQGQFRRITGLDPSGPGFEVMSIACGLAASTADVVDVIHTNGILFGTMRLLGHIDFFPNGGEAQPGCPENPPITILYIRNGLRAGDGQITPGSVRDNVFCDHYRSYEYFIESIRTPCFLCRGTCKNQFMLPGSCTNNETISQSLGFPSGYYLARGIFCLMTNLISPYCKF